MTVRNCRSHGSTLSQEAIASDARRSLLQSCYARLDDAGRERLLEYAALLCDSGDYDRDDSTKTPVLRDVRRLFS